ncbi:MAG TPA: preprotein translocase subunit SecA [Thermomicrobiales bacterium]|nr:preprotein translocase subunit SecA [Thermomicrobiales bacterium]
MRSFFKRLVGDSGNSETRQFSSLLDQINALEPETASKSQDELRAMIQEFRDDYEEPADLDDYLPEVFAAAREVSKRERGQRPFDVQILGAIALHEGNIAEMKTGEGKTLTAALALTLNAIGGGGAHLVTPNDYLAKRDTQDMGRIYHYLGISVACIQHDAAFMFDPEFLSDDETLQHLRPISRREAYLADITYATNNELGFDYLRDNMAVDPARIVQRDLNYAIVDEVDNILIDEARTPLIISGPAGDAADRYYQFAQIIKQLRVDRDYEVDLKHRSATLTEDGIDKVEQLAGIPKGESIYDERHVELTHYLEQALTAHAIYHRDKDYIVRDGEVIIIDEFTGRMMVGRRYSEGLHQAIEAKEGVRVRRQNVTMATITFQNYYRMYDKLAGMTGTADTESEEFYRIYSLNVIVIPTNREMIRTDFGDQVFKTERGKFEAVVREIEEMQGVGRPVLVGTTSVEKSEELSEMLQRTGVPHSVLNAKQHEREAGIVAEAGHRGAVTIATNMAGRGTDIKLEPGIAEIGGLHIVGTERHESRRIDNQLRGRAGRQGDPGSSRFFVSLEDELMRRFGSDRVGGLMDRLGMEEDQPIEHKFISKSIESAQTKVEGHNFDRRKHVVEYDDVMNRHREVIYEDRRKIVAGVNVHERIIDIIGAQVESIVDSHIDEKDSQIDLDGVLQAYDALIPGRTVTVEELEGLDTDELTEALTDQAMEAMDAVTERFPEDMMPKVERQVLLSVIDKLWVDHLTAMDDLRQGVGLQAYGQKDPLVVYKTEGYRMFNQLQVSIQHDVVRAIYRVQPVQAQQPVQTRLTATNLTTNAPVDTTTGQQRKTTKIRPNQPCPCGSGKKYKFCHGAPGARMTA